MITQIITDKRFTLNTDGHRKIYRLPQIVSVVIVYNTKCCQC